MSDVSSSSEKSDDEEDRLNAMDERVRARCSVQEKESSDEEE